MTFLFGKSSEWKNLACQILKKGGNFICTSPQVRHAIPHPGMGWFCYKVNGTKLFSD
jgi:hypothetical protein